MRVLCINGSINPQFPEYENPCIEGEIYVVENEVFLFEKTWYELEGISDEYDLFFEAEYFIPIGDIDETEEERYSLNKIKELDKKIAYYKEVMDSYI